MMPVTSFGDNSNDLDWNVDVVFAASVCRPVEAKVLPWP